MPYFGGHACEIYVGKHDACAVRVPGDDFSVGVEPVSGAFAGSAAVERSVGVHSVEFYFVFNFGSLDAENTCDFAAVQVEGHVAVVAVYRERCLKCDFLDSDFDRAAGCGFRRTGRGLGAVFADAEGERFTGRSDVGNLESRFGTIVPSDCGVGLVRKFGVGSALEERVGGAARAWPLIARVVA